MKHTLPEPGTKAWIAAMRKALQHPQFKLKIDRAACERLANPKN